MSRSIWIKRLLPTITLQAIRTKQEEDEYHLKSVKEIEFSVREADVQPVKGWELSTLPEGYRTKAVFKIFTPTYIQSGKEGTPDLPDKIEYEGDWYVVFKVEPWVKGLDDHYLGYMVSENLR